MEAVIFAGVQASGKSTFYKTCFADTHIRINLDMLGTREREAALLGACLSTGQPFVIDNINLTAKDRSGYVMAARKAGFHVVGYLFDSDLDGVLARNASRHDREPVTETTIRASARRLEPLRHAEGFDDLYAVRIDAARGFVVESISRVSSGHGGSP